MRLVLMGTGPFAVPCFEDLLSSRHDVPLVVTKPELPGPGGKLSPPSPVAELAARHGSRIWKPADINQADAIAELAALRADLLVVCDYGRILQPATLAAARLGGVNLHGSLLPRHRGAAPVNWAIWRGDAETGVSVILMTPRLDAGPCLVQVATPIGPDETAAELEPRLAELGRPAVSRAIEMLVDWNGHSSLGQPQDRGLATKAPRLAKSDGLIDWSRPAASIRDQIRALQPWPGAFTFVRRRAGSLRLLLRQASVGGPRPASAAPGEIVALDDALEIAAADRVLRVLEVQPAGKRSLAAAELIRGRTLKVGQICGPEQN